MKNTVFTTGIMAASMLLLSACVKSLPQEQDPQTVTITFTADKVATKTAAVEDETSMKTSYVWTDEDVANMKLYSVAVDGEGKETLTKIDADVNIVTDTEINISATVATNADYTFRAVLTNETTSGGAARMKTAQTPNGIEGFDPNADILVSEDVNLTVSDGTTGTLPLKFVRYVTVNKMTLQNLQAGEKVQKVTITSNNHITGYLRGTEVVGQYKDITLTYDDVEVPSDGKFPVYFTAMAGEGNSLTIKVNTDQYTYEKTFAEGQTIDFQIGKFTRFGVALPAGVARTSISLPVEDSMTWAIAEDGKDSSAALSLSDIDVKKDGKDVYSEVTKAYIGGVGLKLGTSSVNGSIKTADLDLSSNYYIKVDAQSWLNTSGSADVSQVVFIVDGETKYTSPNLTAAFKTYFFNASAATDASTVEIKVTGKRGYIKNLVIASGEYTLPLAPESLSITDGTTEFEVGDTFAFDREVTLIWNDGNEDVLDEGDFTVDASAVDMTKAGTYTVTVTYNEDENIKATYTITVTGGEVNTHGLSADDPFTASEAVEFVNSLTSTPTTEEYYISGIVTRLANNGQFSTQYGNATFYISDDGTQTNEFEAYRVLYLGNRAWQSGDEIIEAGDEVVVCGRLTKYKTQAETYAVTGENAYNGYLYSLTKTTTAPVPESLTVTGAQQSFSVGDTFTFGGTVTLVYNNQTTATLTASDYTVDSSNVNMAVAGTYTVTVTYNSDSTIQATYDVIVADDHTATLTGTDMSNMSNAGTSYGTVKSITLGDYTWTTNGRQETNITNMIQLRTRTNTNGVSYIQLPEFPGAIQSISMKITQANNNATSYTTTNYISDTKFAVQAGTTSTETVLVEATGSAESNNVVTLDLSSKNITTGYIVITGSYAARIWEISVTFK